MGSGAIGASLPSLVALTGDVICARMCVCVCMDVCVCACVRACGATHGRRRALLPACQHHTLENREQASAAVRSFESREVLSQAKCYVDLHVYSATRERFHSTCVKQNEGVKNKSIGGLK